MVMVVLECHEQRRVARLRVHRVGLMVAMRLTSQHLPGANLEVSFFGHEKLCDNPLHLSLKLNENPLHIARDVQWFGAHHRHSRCIS